MKFLEWSEFKILYFKKLNFEKIVIKTLIAMQMQMQMQSNDVVKCVHNVTSLS